MKDITSETESTATFSSLLHEGQITIDLRMFPYFQDHAFQGMVVLPGSAYVALAVAALEKHAIPLRSTIQLSAVQFENMLIFQDDASSVISVNLTQQADRWIATCSSQDGKTRYAQMTIAPSANLLNHVPPDIFTIQADASPVSQNEFYATLRQAKNEYGRFFQGVHHLWQGEGGALAQIQLDDTLSPGIKQSLIHPVLLDVCTQVMAGVHSGNGRTFMLTGFDQMHIQTPLHDVAWSYSEIVETTANTAKGNIILLSRSQEVVAYLEGAEFQYIGEVEQEKTPLRIAASFTAEPVADSLVFWGETLNSPFDVKFAPYNQLFQQLLDPNSLVSQNNEGLNVLLLRLEDWLRDVQTPQLQIDQTKKEALLANHKRHKLPNQIEIAHLNQYETEYVFKEIFVDRCYMKHGIRLNDGDTVFDIGANIGLFSLFVQHEIKDSTIYAFDPSPPIYDILKTNAQLYGEQIRTFNVGVSDNATEATFTFYEKSSVFSSFAADAEEDETAVREVVINMLQDSGITDPDELARFADELMADRMNSKPYTCRLIPLSDIIRQHNIEQIDLLKVDAEKSEPAILQGIDDEHWSRIKQIVIEVHDRQGDLIRDVQVFLRDKGFNLAIEEETLLKNSGLYNLFGTRDDTAETAVSHPSSIAHKIEQTTADFAVAMQTAAEKTAAHFLLTICPPSPTAANDPILNRLFSQAEHDLQTAVSGIGNVHIVDTQTLLATYPVADYYDPAGDKLGHVPYTSQMFAAIGSMIARKWQAAVRSPYKVIVLDCDNTLWDGVVGEDGVDGINFSGPWTTLQQFMIDQLDKGMVLCLNSKNNEADVMAVFDRFPDMPLKKEHLVGWRINWQPKSANLHALAAELNLGLNSFIFIDDNPIEIAEVNANTPQVLALLLPEKAENFSQFLQHIWAFDHLKTTAEDRKRTKMYQQNRAREQMRQSTTTLSDFLNSLKLNIQIAPPTAAQMPRVAQLTQRTNQFNMSTVRRTQAELEQAIQSGGLEVVTVALSDRFGDYGLVGDLFFTQSDKRLIVDSFLLSCRALGRGVEHEMLAFLGRTAEMRGLSSVDLLFRPSAKNAPAQAFLESVAASHKQTQANDTRYVIPAAEAAALRYEPTTDVAKNYVQSKSVKTAVSADTIPYRHIANTLAAPTAIWQRISANNVQKRKETAPYVAPADNVERTLAKIWQTVLGIDKVGIDDNFRELGGTSLSGVQLIAQLKREMDVHLSIVDLFEYPTIRAMSQFLQKAGAPDAEEINENGRSRGERRRQRRKSRRRR